MTLAVRAEKFAAPMNTSSLATTQAKFAAYGHANFHNRKNPVSWESLAINKLTRFHSFASGWDGHGAPAISAQVTMLTFQVLQQIMGADIENPSIVPSSCGGIQLEWHKKSMDLEILISSPHEIEVFFRDHRSGRVEEFDVLDSDITEIKNLTAQMTI